MPRFLAVMTLALFAAGCHGTLVLYGYDDDDSAQGGELDLSGFSGTESLNIDWDQVAEDQGRVDCAAPFDVDGDIDTEDAQDLCPDCEHIWRVTVVPQPGASDCLEGTGFNATAGIRHYGMEPQLDGAFVLWRSREQDGALEPFGDGDLQDTGFFSWSGAGDHHEDVPGRDLAIYLSGGGQFAHSR